MSSRCHRAFVGLGSNLSGPLGQSTDYLEAALELLDKSDELVFLNRSGFYRSEPWGNPDQPPFVNAVAEIHSHLEPRELLERLLQIEDELGRVRKEAWGPRLIDLDLLCFDDLQLESESLRLPHPHMHERAFVLAPLLELDPGFDIPGKGSARAILERIADDQPVHRL